MSDKPQGVGTTLKDGRWVQVDEYADGRAEVVIVSADRSGRYVIDLTDPLLPTRYEVSEDEDEHDTPAEPRTDDGGRTFYKEEW